MKPKLTLQEKLEEMKRAHTALLATNFYNLETLKGIMEAAAHNRQPVILQLTRSSIEYMGLAASVGMAKAALDTYGIEGWLHLDHGDSIELVAACLDAGFDSVMIDASEKPLDTNIDLTRKVIKMAEKYNANVEAELGYIPKLGQSDEQNGFTSPEEARQFVETTGVNALAVAIGSAHGFYKQEPRLDLDRLEKINAVTDAALVLHGGSGIPASVLREAIDRGICKINLATEIKNIFMQRLKDCLSQNTEIDLRKVFPPAIHSVTELVKEKLEIVRNRQLVKN